MAKKKPHVDPARDIQSILDGLTPENKRAIERRLFITRGYFDDIREQFERLKKENRELRLKAMPSKRRKPFMRAWEKCLIWLATGSEPRTPAKTAAENIALGRECLTKTWGQMYKAHPEMNRHTVRTKAERGLKLLKLKRPPCSRKPKRSG